MVFKYLIRKTRRIVLLLFTSFLVWGLLATFLQQFPSSADSIATSSTTFTLNKIPKSLQSRTIQVLIAHPDDEVMFFAPSIVELSKPKYKNNITLTCLSVGNDQGLGETRYNELVRSLQILGIEDFEIVNDETKFKDSMELEWDADKIAEYISKDTDVILTFDKFGISNHPNHKSLYHGAIASKKPVYALKSWNMAEKYSSTLCTNAEIMLKLFDHSILYLVDAFHIESYLPVNLWAILHEVLYKNVHIYADLPSTILGIAAMSNAHQSQMVWFRWGWLSVSKYGNSNELIKIQ